jgi:hypothetical protein
MHAHHLVPMLALTVSACDSAGLSAVHPDVEADALVDFGTVWEGDLAVATFGVRATGDGHVFVRAIASDNPELMARWNDGRDDDRGTPIGPGTELEVEMLWEATAAEMLSSLVAVETSVPGKEILLVQTSGTARELPNCDDQNPCTDDRFNRDTESCEHGNSSGPCNDGNECTVLDTCYEGACRGIARACNDDNVCTQNLCDPTVGCVYPPNGLLCDDGDPCTKDICDKEDGCSHPDADDGTPCGMFSCAEAHVCFFGNCRAIDVSSATDGLPCADGNPCTEGDACQDGECVGGPLVQRDPQVVATFETFGGEGSAVATDGYRYLFADVDALRVTVLDGTTTLTHVATLPVRSLTPPVLWKPGKFVIAYNNLVAMVDVTDPAAPNIVWEVAIDVPLTEFGGAAVHLAAAERGVVYWVGFGSYSTAENAFDRAGGGDGPYLLPIDPTTDAPGAATALAHDYDVRDLDANGHYVAWVSGTAQHWLELDPSGAPVRQAQYPNMALSPLARVSVRGPRIAVLGANGTQLYDIVAGAQTSETQFALLATYPSFGIEDLVLDDLSLFTLSATGLAVTPVMGCSGVSPDSCYLGSTSSDSMAGSRLDRGPNHLLVSGRIALPLRSVDGAVAPAPPKSGAAERVDAPMGVFERITGQRHGNITAMVDGGGTELLVAGPAAIGRIDLLNQTVTSWSIASVASSMAAPRGLHGALRDALVDTLVGPGDLWCLGPTQETVCAVPVVEIISSDGTTARHVLSDLWGGSADLTGQTLWAYTPFVPDIANCAPPAGIRAWDLSSATGQPGFELQTSPECGSPNYWSTRTRIADNQRHIAFFSAVWDYTSGDCCACGTCDCELPGVPSRAACSPQPVMSVTIYDLADPAGTTPTPFVISTWHDGNMPARDRLATDGARILLGEPARVVLIDPLTVALPAQPQSLDLPYADTTRSVRVSWMANGRAWVGYDADMITTDDVMPNRVPGSYLTQVAYGDGPTPLASEGEVRLPAAADSVFDARLYTVAATKAGVVVIAPACR